MARYICNNNSEIFIITLSLLLSSIIAQDIMFGEGSGTGYASRKLKSTDTDPSSHNRQIRQQGNYRNSPNLQTIADTFQNIFIGLTNPRRPIPPPRPPQKPTPFSNPPTPRRSEEDEECDESVESECTTYDNKVGNCVPLDLCDSLRRLANRPGSNRIIERSKCGCAGTHPFVCCARPQPVPLTLPITTTTRRSTPSSSTTIRTTTTTTRTTPSISNTVQTTTAAIRRPWKLCGYTNATRKKIIGGNEVPVGAWPWMAALGYSDTDKNTEFLDFKCGGSLISKTHVLTAAHCVYNQPNLKIVRLGDHNLYSSQDPVKPIDVEVDQVFISPKYNPLEYQNDIAIVQLRRPVDFTMEIHPICLPNPYDFRFLNLDGEKLFVTGWGETNHQRSPSNVLREVKVEVVQLSICQEKYAKTPAKIDNSQICAAGSPNDSSGDSCRGDSGAPLMVPHETIFDNFGQETYTLIGIVSFGIGCDRPNFPGVYTRVTSFMNWIHNTINSGSKDGK